jgi:choline-glycine betaine transporter
MGFFVYTLYHNSPVVWCLYTTSGLWFVVIMVNKKRHLDWNEITIDKKNNW